VLNLSDKVESLFLLKGGLSLVEVRWSYGKNELSICSTALSSMHPERAWFSSSVVSLEPYTCGYQESTVTRYI
jgi:hypothetical protein